MMKTATAIFLLCVACCFSSDYWYVVVDPETNIEMKSYHSTNAEPSLTSSGNVRIEVSKVEYEADAYASPGERLKSITNFEARAFAALTNAYGIAASNAWNKVKDTVAAQNKKLPAYYRITEDDWLAAWKENNPDPKKAIKSINKP